VLLLAYYIVSQYSGLGVPWAVVGSYSMVPALDIGDIVVLQKTPITEIHVGQVIVYILKMHGESIEIVHRVYEKIVRGHVVFIRTKGDANPIPDPWLINNREIRGVVTLVIPHVGLIGLVLRDLIFRGKGQLILLLMLGIVYLLVTYMLCRVIEE